MEKGLPTSSFSSKYQTHESIGSNSISSTSQLPSESFRTSNQSSSSQPSLESEFNSFITGNQNDSKGKGRQFPSMANDGSDVMRMLNSGLVTEEIYGNWENEMLEDRAGSRLELEMSTPNEPMNQSAVEEQERLELSPEELNYLKLLISLPESQSVSDYLNQNSYTIDLYALPIPIKSLLEEIQDPNSKEEGKTTALRRLAMILEQFNISPRDSELLLNIPSNNQFTKLKLQHELFDSEEFSIAAQHFGTKRSIGHFEW